jgi:hypothetical protein
VMDEQTDEVSRVVWEPWQPKVGQRVRVLSRPECFYCRESPDEDGLIGVVDEIRSPEASTDDGAAHRFWVTFAEVIPSHGCDLSHFAAIELEPVS